MNSFFDYIILDNSVKAYLIAAGVILFAFLIKKYLSRYIAGLLFRLIKRIAAGVDKKNFVNLVVAPLNTFLIILVTVFTLEKLKFPVSPIKIGLLELSPNFRIYKIHLRELIDVLSIIVLIVAFIWLLLRIIDFIALILEQKANLTSGHADNQLVVFFKDFFKALIIINGILMVLKFAFRFDIGNLITGLSIAGAAIALSLRESLENLIASFIIFVDKPFTVGDLVKVQNVTGTVEKIGLRSTRIRSDQKTYVSVPNKQMVDNITDNLTLRSQRRAFVQLELSSETPKGKILQLIQSIEQMLEAKRPLIESHTVLLADINKNAFFVTVEFFTASIPIGEFNRIRQMVNLGIIDKLEELNIYLASKDQDAAQPKELL